MAGIEDRIHIEGAKMCRQKARGQRSAGHTVCDPGKRREKRGSAGLADPRTERIEKLRGPRPFIEMAADSETRSTER